MNLKEMNASNTTSQIKAISTPNGKQLNASLLLIWTN